jgi:hypothetical protein
MKPIPKIPYTPELKERQVNLRKFLRGVPEIQWKELRPFGFQINVGTIPDDKVEEFLKIANSVNYEK